MAVEAYLIHAVDSSLEIWQYVDIFLKMVIFEKTVTVVNEKHFLVKQGKVENIEPLHRVSQLLISLRNSKKMYQLFYSEINKSGK